MVSESAWRSLGMQGNSQDGQVITLLDTAHVAVDGRQRVKGRGFMVTTCQFASPSSAAGSGSFGIAPSKAFV
jgi:hypothetical protein